LTLRLAEARAISFGVMSSATLSAGSQSSLLVLTVTGCKVVTPLVAVASEPLETRSV